MALKSGDKNETVEKVKIICLGDSAVGKSKLVERFLLDAYKSQQLSTYALNIFTHKTKVDGKDIQVDFWDTAGQERFKNIHPSYYNQAHACILVFDLTRKITYKNLTTWFTELREHRSDIPCLCVANKIDVDLSMAKRSYKFATTNKLPMYFVSASDGSNVVKVFQDAIKAAVEYKNTSTDITDEILKELDYYNEMDRDVDYDDDDGDDDDDEKVLIYMCPESSSSSITISVTGPKELPILASPAYLYLKDSSTPRN